MVTRKLIGTLALAILMMTTIAQADWEYQRFDVCPDDMGPTLPYGVSNNGKIVGYCDRPQTGFLWEDGTLTLLRFPGADYSIAYGVNAAGEVVGRYSNETEFWSHGFLWKADRGVVPIDIPGQTATEVRGIRDADGAMVGYVYSSAAQYQAFARNRDGSYILYRFPGAFNTYAYGGNNPDPASDFRDYVIGSFNDATGSHGFVISFGIFTPYDYRDGGGRHHTNLYSINDAVQSVGAYFDLVDGRPAARGFLLQPGSGGTIPINFPGALETIPSGINNAGLVVGFYIMGGRVHGFTACCAPKP